MFSSQASPHVIDFHSHYYDTSWPRSSTPQSSASLARSWPFLTNIEAQLAAMDEAEITAKVLSAPPAPLLLPGQPLPLPLMQRINDYFAELVATYPNRLLALATIDAFQGESAAREVERAIQILGLGGICVDCTQGDHWLDEPQARPTLAVAAALGVPVFIHPVSPAGLAERLESLGQSGTLLARGTENTASLLALLRSGIFDELPQLKIVVPMISAAFFLFAGMADQEYRSGEESWHGSSPSITRRRLYIDTIGLDPAMIRFAIELLGYEQVLIGSDWPITVMPLPSRKYIEQVLTSLDLTAEEQAAIMGGNTLRLLAPHRS